MKKKIKIDQLKVKSFRIQDDKKKIVLSGGTRSHVESEWPICPSGNDPD